MALATFLSTVREIILDNPELPLSNASRLNFFKTHYPQLSLVEIEDLSKIPPEKFKIYTGTIFRGEKATLNNLLPLTFALIQTHYQTNTNKLLDTDQLVYDLHKKYPWKSNATVSLIENFIKYLTDYRLDLLKLAPEIVNTATLELFSLKIARHPEDPLRYNDFLGFDDLKDLTVGELLELNFYLPRLVELYCFDYDVVTLKNNFNRNKEPIKPQNLLINKTFAIGARSKELTVRWLVLSHSIYKFLLELDRKTLAPMENLAQAYIQGLPHIKNESKAFSDFLEILRELIKVGAIRIKQ